MPAFSKALKDGFVHARVVGLSAFTATSDCFDVDDVDAKVIPCIVGATLAKEKIVRDQAFNAMELFRRRQEVDAASMPHTAQVEGDGNAPLLIPGVVLTHTGQPLVTPTPVELANLFVNSPKVGLDFAKIFEFESKQEDRGKGCHPRPRSMNDRFQTHRVTLPDRARQRDRDQCSVRHLRGFANRLSGARHRDRSCARRARFLFLPRLAGEPEFLKAFKEWDVWMVCPPVSLSGRCFTRATQIDDAQGNDEDVLSRKFGNEKCHPRPDIEEEQYEHSNEGGEHEQEQEHAQSYPVRVLFSVIKDNVPTNSDPPSSADSVAWHAWTTLKRILSTSLAVSMGPHSLFPLSSMSPYTDAPPAQRRGPRSPPRSLQARVCFPALLAPPRTCLPPLRRSVVPPHPHAPGVF
ncbi:hypothetical protein JVT61DRAFT_13422 [Boletus reticuloceps]|uniref:Uncharacterized protein n=1 Tax=Boletus reticuloceps TaxID=495285 RepID=A0A8I2YD98_9AGAM|nr:hypothetical protein JVT61DRAFT_13422 [Boletus reticuloceps]